MQILFEFHQVLKETETSCCPQGASCSRTWEKIWKCRFLYFWLKVSTRLEAHGPYSAKTFVLRISESHPLLFIVFLFWEFWVKFRVELYGSQQYHIVPVAVFCLVVTKKYVYSVKKHEKVIKLTLIDMDVHSNRANREVNLDGNLGFLKKILESLLWRMVS